MNEPPRLRVTRLDSMAVNRDHTVTGKLLTEFGQVLEATFTIDDKGNGYVNPADFFTSWNGDAESIRSVIHAAASILCAHTLSPIPRSN